MKPLHTYIFGFGASIALTLLAFWLAWRHVAEGQESPSLTVLVPLFVLLAVIQLVVQLVCFLHLGQERKPHWNLAALAFAFIVVAILVGGTLWIMSELAHMQPHPEPDILTEENIFPEAHEE